LAGIVWNLLEGITSVRDLITGSSTSVITGIGTPVFNVSPRLFKMGSILSPVRGLTVYPSLRFNGTVTGGENKRGISPEVSCFSVWQEPVSSRIRRYWSALFNVYVIYTAANKSCISGFGY
jgi:hypothetical protein